MGINSAWASPMPLPDTTEYIVNGDKQLFKVGFYDGHEGAEGIYVYVDGQKDPNPYFSTYTLSDAMKKSALDGISYMGNIVGPGAVNNTPANVYIFTLDTAEANAASLTNEKEKSWELNFMLDALTNGVDWHEGTGAYINVGIMNAADEETKGWYLPYDSQLPRNGNKFPLAPTLAHEMGHALGITNRPLQYNEATEELTFGNELNSFEKHLYDAVGTQATPGRIVVDDLAESYNPAEYEGKEIFIIRGHDVFRDQSGVYFSGNNVQEVLQGALLGDNNDMPGIPINGWEGKSLDMSHISLRNCLMSHYNYRNYTTFTEAEIALMQDLGYEIDRANFYGKSVYGDNVSLINYQGYSKRNAEGTEYIKNTPNNTAFGVGLHIYGSNNTITQVGNILTNGLAGTGIRIDGLGGNNITVDKAASIAVDGKNGIGVLAAYGHGHTIDIQGRVTALGEGGVAAAFDFGDNVLRNGTNYRGSYVNCYGDDEGILNDSVAIYTPELNGPLVNKLTISGTLAGNKAAIYMAPNAFVKEIDLNKGAQLQGDIISEWGHFAQVDLPPYTEEHSPALQYTDANGNKKYMGKLGADLVTRLNFNADLAYKGNITGTDNIQMNINDGIVNYTGTAHVLGVRVAEGAGLLGGSYVLTDKSDNSYYDGLTTGTLVNRGLIGAMTPEDKDTVLEIDGKLDAQNSRLQFTANNSRVGTISVSGLADVTGATVAIDNKGIYTPNKTYRVELVKSEEELIGSITNMEEYKSGMLTASLLPVNSEGASSTLNILFTPQDNLGTKTPLQQQMYSRVNEALQANSALRENYAGLYNLDKTAAKEALNSIYGNIEADLALAVKQNNYLGEAAWNHLHEQTNDKNRANELWASVEKAWYTWDNNSFGNQLKGQSYAVSLGQDKKLSDKYRAGYMIGYGKHSVSSAGNSGKATDVRLGLYGRYGKDDAGNIDAYVNYGWQNNDIRRNLVNLPVSLKGEYDSNTLSAGLRLSRNYVMDKNTSWSLRPYVNLEAVDYRLQGFTETGDSAYNQHYAGQRDSLVKTGLGLEATRTLAGKGSYSIGASYTRLLKGEAATMEASFAHGQSSYTYEGSALDKNSLSLKLQGNMQVQKNLRLSGLLKQDFAGHTKQLRAAVNAEWSF